VLEVLDRASAGAAVRPDATPEIGPAWRILDVGCGSGVIAVSVAKHLPAAEIVAVDLSPAALEVAGRNATRHGVQDRVQFLQSDLLAAVPRQPLFDCIVSNPPYVSEAEMQELSRDVKDFEPHLALRGGGPDGSQITRRLLDAAPDYLNPGGWLVLETSPMLAPSLLAYAESLPAYQHVSLRKDLDGHARVLVMQTPRTTTHQR
jgi:release factor glutamine methyltransferase